jgi:hypothetical protein
VGSKLIEVSSLPSNDLVSGLSNSFGPRARDNTIDRELVRGSGVASKWVGEGARPTYSGESRGACRIGVEADADCTGAQLVISAALMGNKL